MVLYGVLRMATDLTTALAPLLSEQTSQQNHAYAAK